MFYILSYFVRNFVYQTLFFCHFFLYIWPRELREIAVDALRSGEEIITVPCLVCLPQMKLYGSSRVVRHTLQRYRQESYDD